MRWGGGAFWGICWEFWISVLYMFWSISIIVVVVRELISYMYPPLCMDVPSLFLFLLLLSFA